MWELPLETEQSEAVTNNILAQTTKPKLSQYIHASLFNPKTASLLKTIKQCLLKPCLGLTEKLIKKHFEKSRKTEMVNLHMRRQGLQ